MAFVIKNKRKGYDNIANGSAAGIERLIAGSGGPGDKTSRESVETLGVSADCVNSSFITNRVVELKLGMGGNTSTGDYVGQPSSATTPFWTSQTSQVSTQPERVG